MMKVNGAAKHKPHDPLQSLPLLAKANLTARSRICYQSISQGLTTIAVIGFYPKGECYKLQLR